MQRLQINNTLAEIPASFNEFTGDQLLFLARCIMHQDAEFEVRLKTAMYCAGLKFGKQQSECILPDGSTAILGNTDIWFIASSMNFIYNADGQFQSKLFLNRIPKIEFADGEAWHGPADAIGNLRWDEFCITQTHYGRFLITQDEKYLHELAAVLYRPHSGADPKAADFSGDVREHLNALITEERSKKLIENQPPEFLLTVLWFYAGCLEFINNEFPGVLSDPKKTEDSTEGRSTGNSTDPFDAMMELTDVLCNEDVTSVEKVRSSNLYDVMRRLKNAKEKQKKQQEHIDKIKNKR